LSQNLLSNFFDLLGVESMLVRRSVAELRGTFDNEENRKKVMINWLKLLISFH